MPNITKYVSCDRCRYYGEVAFDSRCPRCGWHKNDKMKKVESVVESKVQCDKCGKVYANGEWKGSCDSCGHGQSVLYRMTKKESRYVYYGDECIDCGFTDTFIGEQSAQQIADNPPKFVPIERHDIWKNLVLKGGHTSYAGAVAHYQRHVMKHGTRVAHALAGESKEEGIHPIPGFNVLGSRDVGYRFGAYGGAGKWKVYNHSHPSGIEIVYGRDAESNHFIQFNHPMGRGFDLQVKSLKDAGDIATNMKYQLDMGKTSDDIAKQYGQSDSIQSVLDKWKKESKYVYFVEGDAEVLRGFDASNLGLCQVCLKSGKREIGKYNKGTKCLTHRDVNESDESNLLSKDTKQAFCPQCFKVTDHIKQSVGSSPKGLWSRGFSACINGCGHTVWDELGTTYYRTSPTQPINQ